MFYSTRYDSPVGLLEITYSNKGIRRILLPGREHIEGETAAPDSTNKIVVETIKKLSEYFNGHRQRFDIPLDLNGTEFQIVVWESLLGIEYGSTSTYGAIAKKIGRPKAARAVGAANAVNPIPILIPCHRVIGGDGNLTGYGGGSELLHIKEYLLNLERSKHKI
tara:strand:+ start:2572 stop:3063 length:492 start_codon:yes stop_codon:yes gene_type:complete